MAAFAFVSAISAGAQVASLDLCADEYLLMFARNEQVAAVSRERIDYGALRLPWIRIAGLHFS